MKSSISRALANHLIEALIKTGNVSNFVTTFVQFGIETDLMPDMPSTSHDVNCETDDIIASLLTDSAFEQKLEYILFENVLATPDANNINEDAIVKNRDLPVGMYGQKQRFIFSLFISE